MTGEDGSSRVAHDRLARFDPAGVRTSLLPVAGAVGIESVGFTPVGDVMGCMVEYFGWVGGANYGAGAFLTGSVSFQPYVDALYRGYDTALARLAAEATAMGADGVVDIRLSKTSLSDSNNQEFVALGTAVRANSAQRPRSLFTTSLAGQDFAKLMQSGWVSVKLTIGISVQARYLDWASAQQMSMMFGNGEVNAHTALINGVRARARNDFAKRAKNSGSDGAIVSDMAVRSWEQEVNNSRLLCAESSVFGTSIARFHAGRAAPTRSLTIMPLR